MRRTISRVLFACVPGMLLAGCADDPAGPAQADNAPITGPAFVGLLLPAVQKAREGHSRVVFSDGTSNTLMISERLHQDGTAHGFAALADVDDRSRRVHYRFRRGRLTCEAGVPRVHLTGVERAGREVGRFRITLQRVESDERRFGIQMKWTYERSDVAGRTGESFVARVDEFLVSRDACAR